MQPFGWAAASAPDFTSLVSLFGDRLSFVRDGNRVQWSLDGRAAIVELCAGQRLEATFVDRPTLEGVTARTAMAMYRRTGGSYSLAPDGCARMVADIVAFFDGAREPRFAFAGIAGGGSA